MSAVNPYAPPQAGVADLAPSEFSKPQVWSYRGRIGRARYIAYTAVGYLAVVCVGFFAGLVGAALGSSSVSMAILVVAFIAYAVLIALAGIQRSHDMDWSGWTMLGAIIPLVGLIWLFKPGTPGPNRFGHPPPPNGAGVIVSAWLFGALFVIGILAAISLPAYQSYVQRAKAAQAAVGR